MSDVQATADRRGRANSSTGRRPCSASTRSCTAIRGSARRSSWCSRSSSSALLNSRFFAPANLSLIAQQVAVVGALADRPDADHPDRGHRPVGRRDHGLHLDGDGRARRELRPARAARARPRACSSAASLAALNGLLVTRLRLPPFIVTLGTLNIFTALTLLYSGGQTDPGARTSRTSCCGPARRSPIGRSASRPACC